MSNKQLELPMPKEKYAYNLYRMGLVFSTNDKQKMWDKIGEAWGPYEVLDSDGMSVEEFIPF